MTRRMARKTAERQKAVDVPPVFARVVAAFAHDRRVSRRRMFSSDTVLSVNGKIFAMVARGKFVAKLPKDRVDSLVSAGIGQRFDPGHGRLMKEWLAVGPGKAEWVELAQEAYRYVQEARAPRAVGAARNRSSGPPPSPRTAARGRESSNRRGSSRREGFALSERSRPKR